VALKIRGFRFLILSVWRFLEWNVCGEAFLIIVFFWFRKSCIFLVYVL
jgi:hypothetical protein